MQERIEEVLTSRGYISSALQLALLYLILNFPRYISGWIQDFTGTLIFTENISISIIILAVFATYYSYIIKNLSEYLGYIKDRAELKVAVIFYFIYWVLVFIVPGLLVIWMESDKPPRPDFGVAGFSLDNTHSILNDTFVVTTYFNGTFILIILAIISLRTMFGKYQYRNIHKKKSLEELKAVLSPAAMKVYEKKEESEADED